VNEVSFAQESSGAMPEVAFTFDDPQLVDYPGASGSSWADVDFMLRRALRQAGVKATLFVCGMRVDNAEGKKLLQAWNDDGHVLANHSYSHLYFHSDKVTLAQFEGDALKGENVVSGYPRFQKTFRYPFFKEGDTIEKRDGMRWWLAQRGYKMGRATIDASDWAIDGRMRKRLEKGPKADLAGYRVLPPAHLGKIALLLLAGEKGLGKAGTTHRAATSSVAERVVLARSDCDVSREWMESGGRGVCVPRRDL
jgi:peptidoglycan/xylan/chitin deacetylase (PgdA/CDA1 family)